VGRDGIATRGFRRFLADNQVGGYIAYTTNQPVCVQKVPRQPECLIYNSDGHNNIQRRGRVTRHETFYGYTLSPIAVCLFIH